MTENGMAGGAGRLRDFIQIVIAAVAMTATLPGRTHGIGLVTEHLLADLELDAFAFAKLNFWSAIIGSLLSFPIGWLIDRWSIRAVLASVTLALGLAVWGMAQVTTSAQLLVALICVRGLGQSALSLLSIALIAKYFERRIGIKMGMFAVLLTIGFIASVLLLGRAIADMGWSRAWTWLGWILMATSGGFFCFVSDNGGRSRVVPEASRTERDWESTEKVEMWSLRKALATPTYWILVLGAGLFNLVWSAVTLFNESLMREKQLSPEQAVEVMAILTGIGLVANMAGGLLARRTTLLHLQAVGMALLAVALGVLAYGSGLPAARWYAALTGASGGVITVVFFAAWREIFGQPEWGQLQGGAQMATVLASALGPVLFAASQSTTQSAESFLVVLGTLCGVVAICSWPRKGVRSL